MGNNKPAETTFKDARPIHPHVPGLRANDLKSYQVLEIGIRNGERELTFD